MDSDPDAETIFQQASQLPAEELTAFLHRVCHGNPALRGAVETLLHSREPVHGSASASGPPGSSREIAGTMIGRYRLIAPLGEGGMGSVWMAEQREPMVRDVALKIIKLGMDTEEVVTRFEQERQALALMDHPCIAKVFDAGSTDSGRPFFVMELVQGVPLTDFCNGQNLGVRERLALFIQVCQAIQHAHQKGIIHRDLKPSNILVAANDEGQPLPKVIDFGIAKATGPALAERTALTQFAQVIGTPAYMSPEQAGLASMDIDTRSDIYSLGVLLYELLTGRPPFDPQQLISAGLEEMRRIIREEDPPRPSTRISLLAGKERTAFSAGREATAARLATALRGDLDWIVMKALEKDRSRRYETVGALAADIHRHLGNQPVLASPPGPMYLLSRFVRRHKIGFAAGTSVVLALLGGIMAATWGFMNAEAERRTAAAERDKARRARGTAEGLINSMLYGLRDKLKPIGRLDLLDDVSLQAEQYFGNMPAEDITPAVLREKASMLTNRGSVLVAQGKLPAARQVYEQALAIMVKLEQLDPANTNWLQHQSVCHERLGALEQSAGNLAAARTATAQALAISERLASSKPEDPDTAADLASGYDRMADVELASSQLQATADAYAKALAIRERLVLNEPDNDSRQRSLAVSCQRLGELAKTRGDLNGAAASLDKAVALLERLLQRDPADTERQRDLSVCYCNVGDVARASGNLSAASASYLKDLAISKRLAAGDPDNAEWQRNLATSHTRMSDLAMDGGDFKAAAAEMDKAIAIRERLAKSDPVNADWQTDLAGTLQGAYHIAERLGNLKSASEAAEKSLAIMVRLAAGDPGNADRQEGLAISCTLAGDVAMNRADNAAARKAYEQALAIRQQLADQHPDNAEWQRSLAETSGRMGDILLAAQDLPAARRGYEKAQAIHAQLAARSPENAVWQRGLALSWSDLGNLARVEGDKVLERQAYQQALAISGRLALADPGNEGRQHDWYVSNVRMSEVEEADGNMESARKHRKQAFTILKTMKANGATLSAASMLFYIRESLRGD